MTPLDPRLLRMLPAARVWVSLLGFTGLAHGLAAIAQAFAVSTLVVAVAEGRPAEEPLRWTVLSLCLRGLTAAATEVAAARAGAEVSTRLRAMVCRWYVATDADSRTPTAHALTRAVQGTSSVEPYLTRYLPALVQALVLPVAAVVAIATLDWPTAVIPVLTVPLLPLFAALIGSATAQATSARWQTLSRLSGHFLDVMRGLPTLVGYGRAEHQVETVRRVSHDHRRATVATLRLAFLSSAALELLATLSVALVAVSVGIRLAGGSLPLSVAMPLILLAPEAYWPIRRVGAEFHAAADGAAALADILSDLERPTSADPDRTIDAGAVGPVGRRVVLDRVGYHFPGDLTPVLADVTAVLPTGLTVVTGPSGAGKTTFLELVAGIRRPTTGTVSSPPAHLVTQVPFLAATSVRENLVLAADDDQGVAAGSRCAQDLASALRQVGLYHTIAALPEGMDTLLGDDGFGLSAGQRARLATARALLSGRQVLLFDEPTAHLDPETEAALNETLRELARDRVVVVVTHRDALVDVADQVLRLAAGHLAATGTAPALPVRTPVGRSQARLGGSECPAEGSRVPAPESAATEPRVRGLGTSVLAGTAALTSGLALTATSGWLIVAASFRPQILTLMAAVAGVRAFGVARPVLRYVERVRSHDTSLAWLADHRARLYARLIPLTPARLGRRSRGDLLAGVVDDLDDVAYAQVRVTVPVWGMIGTGIAAAALAATQLPTAGVVLAGLVLATAVAGLVEARWEHAVQGRVVTARAAVVRATTTLIARAPDVAAVAGLPGLMRHLAHGQRQLISALSRQGVARAAGAAAVPLLVAVTLLALTPLVVDAVSTGLGTPSAGLLLLLPVALAEVGSGLPDASGAWARARQSRRRLADLVSHRPAVSPGPENNGSARDVPTGSRTAPQLELTGVSATWDGVRPALLPTDLSLPPGHHLALVGPNGCGKSTLLAVLARHVDPSLGRYAMDGEDVTRQPLVQTRAAVAVVDDEPHVFASTVRENLRLAQPGADDAALTQALVLAGLGSWAAALPDGLDTVIGAGGRGVSGGERARLALARAVISLRPVLLLDEPTAHLDEATARAVLADLRTAALGRTTVLVTHRPEGADGADEVRELVPPAQVRALPRLESDQALSGADVTLSR